ncbi:ectoine hydroxylase [Nitriliruptoraceae bacterium ZYF776]|nr:ectoine hydroxylase [Profundirhabdus halotolerans]
MSSTTIHDPYPTRVAGTPEILDRVDPVVAEGATGPLRAEQVAAFERDGFLFLEDVFTPEEVKRYADELARLSSDPEVRAMERTVTERGTDEVRSIFEVHTLSERFAAMSRDARLADVTRQLLGGDVYLHQTRVNSKPGFRGKEFYWHSDFETWHSEDGMPRMRAISASIALTDNTEFNGPLMVMPGSHTRFVTCVGETPEDNYKSSLQAQEIGVPDHDSLRALADEFGIVAPKGRAGSVVFFDSNLMHGSNGNITPFPRSNAFFVYNHVDNALVEPFAAPGPRPSHIAHREVEVLPRG